MVPKNLVRPRVRQAFDGVMRNSPRRLTTTKPERKHFAQVAKKLVLAHIASKRMARLWHPSVG